MDNVKRKQKYGIFWNKGDPAGNLTMTNVNEEVTFTQTMKYAYLTRISRPNAIQEQQKRQQQAYVESSQVPGAKTYFSQFMNMSYNEDSLIASQLPDTQTIVQNVSQYGYSIGKFMSGTAYTYQYLYQCGFRYFNSFTMIRPRSDQIVFTRANNNYLYLDLKRSTNAHVKGDIGLNQKQQSISADIEFLANSLASMQNQQFRTKTMMAFNIDISDYTYTQQFIFTLLSSYGAILKRTVGTINSQVNQLNLNSDGQQRRLNKMDHICALCYICSQILFKVQTSADEGTFIANIKQFLSKVKQLKGFDISLPPALSFNLYDYPDIQRQLRLGFHQCVYSETEIIKTSQCLNSQQLVKQTLNDYTSFCESICGMTMFSFNIGVSKQRLASFLRQSKSILQRIFQIHAQKRLRIMEFRNLSHQKKRRIKNPDKMHNISFKIQIRWFLFCQLFQVTVLQYALSLVTIRHRIMIYYQKTSDKARQDNLQLLNRCRSCIKPVYNTLQKVQSLYTTTININHSQQQKFVKQVSQHVNIQLKQTLQLIGQQLVGQQLITQQIEVYGKNKMQDQNREQNIVNTLMQLPDNLVRVQNIVYNPKFRISQQQFQKQRRYLMFLIQIKNQLNFTFVNIHQANQSQKTEVLLNFIKKHGQYFSKSMDKHFFSMQKDIKNNKKFLIENKKKLDQLHNHASTMMLTQKNNSDKINSIANSITQLKATMEKVSSALSGQISPQQKNSIKKNIQNALQNQIKQKQRIFEELNRFRNDLNQDTICQALAASMKFMNLDQLPIKITQTAQAFQTSIKTLNENLIYFNQRLTQIDQKNLQYFQQFGIHFDQTLAQIDGQMTKILTASTTIANIMLDQAKVSEENHQKLMSKIDGVDQKIRKINSSIILLRNMNKRQQQLQQKNRLADLQAHKQSLQAIKQSNGNISSIKQRLDQIGEAAQALKAQNLQQSISSLKDTAVSLLAQKQSLSVFINKLDGKIEDFNLTQQRLSKMTATNFEKVNQKINEYYQKMIATTNANTKKYYLKLITQLDSKNQQAIMAINAKYDKLTSQIAQQHGQTRQQVIQQMQRLKNFMSYNQQQVLSNMVFLRQTIQQNISNEGGMTRFHVTNAMNQHQRRMSAILNQINNSTVNNFQKTRIMIDTNQKQLSSIIYNAQNQQMQQAYNAQMNNSSRHHDTTRQLDHINYQNSILTNGVEQKIQQTRHQYNINNIQQKNQLQNLQSNITSKLKNSQEMQKKLTQLQIEISSGKEFLKSGNFSSYSQATKQLAKIQQLNRQIQNLVKQNSKYQNENQRVLQSLKTLTGAAGATSQVIHARIAVIMSQIKKQQSKITSQLKKSCLRCQDTMNEMSTLKTQFGINQHKLNALTKQKFALQQQKNQLKRQRDQTMKRLNLLTQEGNNTASMLNTQTQRAQQLSIQYQRLRKQASVHFQRLQEQYQTAQQQKDEVLKKLQKKTEELSKIRQQLAVIQTRSQTQVNNSNSRIKRLQDELRRTKQTKQQTESQIKNVQQQVVDKQLQLGKATNQLDALSAQHKKTVLLLQKQAKRNKQMQQEKRKATVRIQQLQQQVKRLQTRSQISFVKEAERTKYENQSSIMQRKLEAQKQMTEQTTKMMIIQQKQNQILNLQTKLKGITNALALAGKTQNDIHSLAAKMAASKEKIMQLTLQLQRANQKNISLKGGHQKQIEKKDKLIEKQKVKLQRTRNQLQAEIRKRQQMQTSNRQQQRKFQKKQTEYLIQIQKLKAAQQRAEGSQRHMSGMYQSLNKKKMLQEARHAQIIQKQNKLQQTIHSKDKQILQTKFKMQTAQSNYQNKCTQLTAQKQRVQMLEKQLKQNQKLSQQTQKKLFQTQVKMNSALAQAQKTQKYKKKIQQLDILTQKLQKIALQNQEKIKALQLRGADKQQIQQKKIQLQQQLLQIGNNMTRLLTAKKNWEKLIKKNRRNINFLQQVARILQNQVQVQLPSKIQNLINIMLSEQLTQQQYDKKQIQLNNLYNNLKLHEDKLIQTLMTLKAQNVQTKPYQQQSTLNSSISDQTQQSIKSFQKKKKEKQMQSFAGKQPQKSIVQQPSETRKYFARGNLIGTSGKRYSEQQYEQVFKKAAGLQKKMNEHQKYYDCVNKRVFENIVNIRFKLGIYAQSIESITKDVDTIWTDPQQKAAMTNIFGQFKNFINSTIQLIRNIGRGYDECVTGSVSNQMTKTIETMKRKPIDNNFLQATKVYVEEVFTQVPMLPINISSFQSFFSQAPDVNDFS